MVRPIAGCNGPIPRGTVEERRVKICFGSSGRAYAVVVCVRAGDLLMAVLMPVYDHVDSAEVYESFLTNTEKRLRVNDAEYDIERGVWMVSRRVADLTWPKESDVFTID